MKFKKKKSPEINLEMDNVINYFLKLLSYLLVREKHVFEFDQINLQIEDINNLFEIYDIDVELINKLTNAGTQQVLESSYYKSL